MLDYTHHIPGRLRMRTASVKDNPSMACAVQSLILSISGVKRVETNTVTGSLTTYYDTSATSGDAIVALLRTHGYTLHRSVPTRRPQRTPDFTTVHVSRLLTRVAVAVVETVAERGIVKLVGALI